MCLPVWHGGNDIDHTTEILFARKDNHLQTGKLSLQTGKLSWTQRITSHPGQLSLAISLWVDKRHTPHDGLSLCP